MTWIQIEDFNYEINELGEVRNTKFGNRPINPYNNGNRYFYVDLQKDGKSFPRGIHVLLMRYFGDGEVKHEVNHKDGNPSNNSLSNLEWVTRSENHKHRYHILKTGPKKGVHGRFQKTT